VILKLPSGIMHNHLSEKEKRKEKKEKEKKHHTFKSLKYNIA